MLSESDLRLIVLGSSWFRMHPHIVIDLVFLAVWCVYRDDPICAIRITNGVFIMLLRSNHTIYELLVLRIQYFSDGHIDIQ